VGWTARGQLAYLSRPGSKPDTVLGYHPAGENFRLCFIRHGADTSDALPDVHYTAYDDQGRITAMEVKLSGNTQSQSFAYDALDRLTSAALSGSGSYGTPYSHSYSYDELGNLTNRNGSTRIYHYDDPAHVHAVSGVTGDLVRDFDYDANGNMTRRDANSNIWTYTFDVQNRLVKVENGANDTFFAYDANGQRVLTIQPNGTKIYTPFPEYEETVPTSGATTKRSHYFLAVQLIAVRVAVTGGSSALYYTCADHLGNISAMTNTSGTYIATSTARYEPFGGYRTQPAATVNPGISDRSFTGHKGNNTGTYDLDLIYMNARYYLPEIGRFISPDTVVPDPQNPQSFNRYSYVLNSPLNLTDPGGHRPHNLIRIATS
jgi:RHS repeat-associated protein